MMSVKCIMSQLNELSFLANETLVFSSHLERESLAAHLEDS